MSYALPPQFTLTQLQRVYERLYRFDRKNLRLAKQGFVFDV